MPYLNLQSFAAIKQSIEMCCLGMWIGVSVLRCDQIERKANFHLAFIHMNLTAGVFLQSEDVAP